MAQQRLLLWPDGTLQFRRFRSNSLLNNDLHRRDAAPDRRFEASRRRFEASNRRFGASKLGFEASKPRFGASRTGFEASNPRLGASKPRFEASKLRFEASNARVEASKHRFKASKSCQNGWSDQRPRVRHSRAEHPQHTARQQGIAVFAEQGPDTRRFRAAGQGPTSGNPRHPAAVLGRCYPRNSTRSAT